MELPKTLNLHHTLRCSVCNNYLNVAPVLTSEDGKFNKCGRCNLKGPQLSNRNSLYESIGSKLSFPCVNEKCTARLSWQEVERHEKTCSYRQIPCPFWACREKDIKINMLTDPGHFRTDHPGIVNDAVVTGRLTDLKKHPSFMKLFFVDDLPYLVMVHAVATGERVWIGVFNFDQEQKDYQIRLFGDKNARKSIIYKEPITLYDENQQCLYCLQNLCDLEGHRFSKCYPENQKEKFKFFTKIDVLCTKNVLLTGDMCFEITVVPPEVPLSNGKS